MIPSIIEYCFLMSRNVRHRPNFQHISRLDKVQLTPGTKTQQCTNRLRGKTRVHMRQKKMPMAEQTFDVNRCSYKNSIS